MTFSQYEKSVKVIVEAEQITGTITAGGQVVAKAGDWEVKSGSGDRYFLTNEEFVKEGYLPLANQG